MLFKIIQNSKYWFPFEISDKPLSGDKKYYENNDWNYECCQKNVSFKRVQKYDCALLKVSSKNVNTVFLNENIKCDWIA